MQFGLCTAAAASAFVAAFRELPAPGNGWRGGFGRFLQSAIMAILAWEMADAAWQVFHG